MVNNFLKGIKVVDLSQYLPGPFAGLILGDLGADVIKVEPPSKDPIAYMPPMDADGSSGMYKMLNRNKRTLYLDMKSEEGKAAFAELIKEADVLIESFRPDVLPRLGFPQEKLDELNPQLIHTSLSGYGATGPLSTAPGHDLNYLAICGGLISSGTEETPTITFPPMADHASGQHAAMTTIAALFSRTKTNKGAVIDVSIAESVITWQAWNLNNASYTGKDAARRGDMLNGGTACYNIYKTNDEKFVTLGEIEAKFWVNFCNTVDHPEWIERHMEKIPQTGLIAEVTALISSQSQEYWVKKFEGIDICFQPVISLLDLPDHPHIKARGLVSTHKVGDRTAVEPLFPAWVDGNPPCERTPWRETTLSEVMGDWKS